MLMKLISYICILICVSTSALNAVEWGQFDGDGKQQLSQSKERRIFDTPDDIERAYIDHYLHVASPGKLLAEFQQPGAHNVRLDYSSYFTTKATETFLSYLLNHEVSETSNWTIVTYSQFGCTFNVTLLSAIIAHLPNITQFHWEVRFPIPNETHDVLQSSHPQCRLYCELDFYFEGFCLSGEDPASIIKMEEDLVQDPIRIDFNGYTTHQRYSLGTAESIINSTILYSLKIYQDRSQYDLSSENMELMHRIFASSPNLRELQTVRNYLDDYEASPINLPAYRQMGFDFEMFNVSLPSLESLKLDQYKLHTCAHGRYECLRDIPLGFWVEESYLRWPWSQFSNSTIKYVGERVISRLGGLGVRNRREYRTGTENPTNLDAWLELMDWGNLRTLEILEYQYPETLEKLEWRLRNIENLRINGDAIAVKELLENTIPLKSIILDYTEPDVVIDVIIDHHGAALTNLTLLHYDPWDPELLGVSSKERIQRLYLLTTNHLDRLRQYSPHLTSLHIDLLIDKEVNYVILDALAMFPNLVDLSLSLHLKNQGVVTDDSSYDRNGQGGPDFLRGRFEVIAAYLRERKIGRKFKNVDAHSGWKRIEVNSLEALGNKLLWSKAI